MSVKLRATNSVAKLTAIALGAAVGAATAPASAAEKLPAYNWSGFYAGLNAGGGWSRTAADLGQLFHGDPTPLTDGTPPSFSGHSSGFIGGGQVGYNFQANSIVLGVEADLSDSAVKGAATFNQLIAYGSPPTATNLSVDSSQKLQWLATIRGRVGYAPIDPLLVYFHGGLAIGEIENPILMTFTDKFATITYAGSASSTRTGWTLGGGAEYGISSNWTAKLEYLYVDLGGGAVVTSDRTAGNPTQFTASFNNNHFDIVRAGVNYKFGQ